MAWLRSSPARKPLRLALLLLLLGLAGACPPRAWADDKPVALPPALTKLTPESVEDLRAIQKQVRTVIDQVMPAVVGVRIGNGSGSGVIVSEDGYVLTAGHVSGKPGQDATLILPDGKRVKGKTLGSYQSIDSGLIKINGGAKWPHAEMGKSADLKRGQWCLAIGHPRGFIPGRAPVVRLGRVLSADERTITTDAALVGGDSGGPLFDLTGKVIGIHSRIGPSMASNMHVPVDTYRDTWERLVKSEVWSDRDRFAGRRNRAWMGFSLDLEAKECRIAEVKPMSPAEKAGFKPNDVVTEFDGKKIASSDDLSEVLRRKKPGDEVAVVVRRGKDVVTLKVILGKRDG